MRAAKLKSDGGKTEGLDPGGNFAVLKINGSGDESYGQAVATPVQFLNPWQSEAMETVVRRSKGN
jgi:hypothetical protein